MTEEKKNGFRIPSIHVTKDLLRRMRMPVAIVLLILLADQVLKIWVKTHMQIGESIPMLGDWFKIYFVENEGMAFGMAFGGKVGKIILTLFRIVASVGITWAIFYLVQNKARKLTIISVSLILAGALGNIIDSCFYGLIFNDSYYQVAEFMPESGGYAPFFQGRVVDMFYFPIIDTILPNWLPLVGGKHFTFFDAIFNIADCAITIGVALLLIDQIAFEKKNKTTDGSNAITQQQTQTSATHEK
ncbi:MAG: lipoprotein signal peptidase [Bacteroidales bacterium]|nr:lipoprotein signal peptidase [Bacteroidales bacterium]